LNSAIEHEYAGSLGELSTWWWDEARARKIDFVGQR
jgi:hypothetical protein